MLATVLGGKMCSLVPRPHLFLEVGLVPRPHLFLEVGLVNFLGCAESAYHMISIATEQ